MTGLCSDIGGARGPDTAGFPHSEWNVSLTVKAESYVKCFSKSQFLVRYIKFLKLPVSYGNVCDYKGKCLHSSSLQSTFRLFQCADVHCMFKCLACNSNWIISF